MDHIMTFSSRLVKKVFLLKMIIIIVWFDGFNHSLGLEEALGPDFLTRHLASQSKQVDFSDYHPSTSSNGFFPDPYSSYQHQQEPQSYSYSPQLQLDPFNDGVFTSNFNLPILGELAPGGLTDAWHGAEPLPSQQIIGNTNLNQPFVDMNENSISIENYQYPATSTYDHAQNFGIYPSQFPSHNLSPPVYQYSNEPYFLSDEGASKPSSNSPDQGINGPYMHAGNHHLNHDQINAFNFLVSPHQREQYWASQLINSPASSTPVEKTPGKIADEGGGETRNILNVKSGFLAASSQANQNPRISPFNMDLLCQIKLAIFWTPTPIDDRKREIRLIDTLIEKVSKERDHNLIIKPSEFAPFINSAGSPQQKEPKSGLESHNVDHPLEQAARKSDKLNYHSKSIKEFPQQASFLNFAYSVHHDHLTSALAAEDPLYEKLAQHLKYILPDYTKQFKEGETLIRKIKLVKPMFLVYIRMINSILVDDEEGRYEQDWVYRQQELANQFIDRIIIMEPIFEFKSSSTTNSRDLLKMCNSSGLACESLTISPEEIQIVKKKLIQARSANHKVSMTWRLVELWFKKFRPSTFLQASRSFCEVVDVVKIRKGLLNKNETRFNKRFKVFFNDLFRLSGKFLFT